MSYYNFILYYLLTCYMFTDVTWYAYAYTIVVRNGTILTFYSKDFICVTACQYLNLNLL